MKRAVCCSAALLAATNPAHAFVSPAATASSAPAPAAHRPITALCATTSAPTTGAATNAAAAMGDAIATTLVNSPLYPWLLKSARETMKKAVSDFVQWDKTIEERKAAVDWDKAVEDVRRTRPDIVVPEYYLRKFHAYDEGNLCLDAALEQDLASAAVGARNYPATAAQGERILRDSYDACMDELGVTVNKGALIADFGCGTGISTADLAKKFPHAARVVGIDLSPHMLAAGQYLLQEQRGGGALQPSVEFVYGDVATRLLPEGSVDFVSFNLVLHELPDAARRAAFSEALRILKPGGALGIMEMDPDAPGYVKLRGNAVLYSIMKSTEPYLDQYFASAAGLTEELVGCGFAVARETQATNRHKVVVAFKAGTADFRRGPVARARADRAGKP